MDEGEFEYCLLSYPGSFFIENLSFWGGSV